MSKLADAFSLESQELKWIVDNIRHDTAVGSSAVSVGTRVRFQANPTAIRDLSELFGAYTTDLTFDTTQTVVKMFEIGDTFVSRSEAKRLLHNLERFRHVILDFANIDQIGQGFADEIFRVWRRASSGQDLDDQHGSGGRLDGCARPTQRRVSLAATAGSGPTRVGSHLLGSRAD